MHAAGIQDRDGAVPLLASIRHAFPWLRHVFADSGYAGAKLETALAALGNWTIEIVKRPDSAKGFDCLPRRWVVERTLAWLNATVASPRTSKPARHRHDWLLLASVKLLSRQVGWRDNQPSWILSWALRSRRPRPLLRTASSYTISTRSRPLRAVGTGRDPPPRRSRLKLVIRFEISHLARARGIRLLRVRPGH